MLSHRAAKLRVSPTLMSMAQNHGHVFVRLFGYPLEYTTRMRARTVLSYLPKKDCKLLEIGCSFGILAFDLARRGYQVTGLDVNPVSIELANKINEILNLKNVRFFNMDFSDNRFPPGEFDIVVMVEVLEHIKYDARAIDEIYRILREDGVLIVSVPYGEAQQELPVPVPACSDFEGKARIMGVPGELHFRSGYSREGLISLLNLSGFRVERCGWTKAIRILPKSIVLFPLFYAPALALSKLTKRRAKLTVLARKGHCNASTHRRYGSVDPRDRDWHSLGLRDASTCGAQQT